MERTIVYIDGTNFLSELTRILGVSFEAYDPPSEAISIAKAIIQRNRDHVVLDGTKWIRFYWFGSYKGQETEKNKYYDLLKRHNFDPQLFRLKGEREKGVDIALTKQSLINAFQGNIDRAVIVAGDTDYVGLVSEIKRHGIVVNGHFFNKNMPVELLRVFDNYLPINIESYNDDSHINQLLLALKKKLNKGNKSKRCNYCENNHSEDNVIKKKKYIICKECVNKFYNELQ